MLGCWGRVLRDGETKCTLLMSPSFEMQIIGEQRDFSRKLPLTSSVTLASNFVRLLKKSCDMIFINVLSFFHGAKLTAIHPPAAPNYYQEDIST